MIVVDFLLVNISCLYVLIGLIIVFFFRFVIEVIESKKLFVLFFLRLYVFKIKEKFKVILNDFVDNIINRYSI